MTLTRWLVDGNNVMGTRPDGWWRDRPGAQRRLADELRAFAQRTGEPLTVVFDGAPVDIEAAPPGFEVAFAERRGRDAADDAIVQRVADAGDSAAALRVVTSDRALADRVRALGAEVTPARALLDLL